jgi:hypothetical protein
MQNKRRNSVIQCLIFLLVLLFSGYPATAAERKPLPGEKGVSSHIMIITSQPYVTKWFISLDHAFTDGLHQVLSPPAQVSYEYMDGKKLADPRFLAIFRELLREKYGRLGIDLVIGVMPAGSGFLLAHGGELFPGVPIVPPSR